MKESVGWPKIKTINKELLFKESLDKVNLEETFENKN